MAENDKTYCFICKNKMEKLLNEFDKKIKKYYGFGIDLKGNEVDEIPEIGDSDAPDLSIEKEKYICYSNHNYWYRHYKNAYFISEEPTFENYTIGYFGPIYHNVKTFFRTKVEYIISCAICNSYLNRNYDNIAPPIVYHSGAYWIYNPDLFFNQISLAKKTVIREYKKDNKIIEDAFRELIKDKKRIEKLKESIICLLKEKAIKMPYSDIDAFLKHQNVNEIKEVCEIMYNNKQINFAGNGRYFVLSEKNKSNKNIKSKSTSNVANEIRNFAKLRDDGLITNEEYDIKKKKLLEL